MTNDCVSWQLLRRVLHSRSPNSVVVWRRLSGWLIA